MTEDARKRLEAIESMEDLGAGFTLATHDLEICGAGELLGDEQSGQIHEIGFSLYMDLLERAVQALKAGRTPELSGLRRSEGWWNSWWGSRPSRNQTASATAMCWAGSLSARQRGWQACRGYCS
jgi:hypothetical protein